VPLFSLSNIPLKMNDDYSYVGVPATTQEATKEDNNDHALESSGILVVAGPELEAPAAQKLSGPTVVGPSLQSIA
jgi:hypothetical protein